jgi:hypothetical protein
MRGAQPIWQADSHLFRNSHIRLPLLASSCALSVAKLGKAWQNFSSGMAISMVK